MPPWDPEMVILSRSGTHCIEKLSTSLIIAAACTKCHVISHFLFAAVKVQQNYQQ